MSGYSSNGVFPPVPPSRLSAAATLQLSQGPAMMMSPGRPSQGPPILMSSGRPSQGPPVVMSSGRPSQGPPVPASRLSQGPPPPQPAMPPIRTSFVPPPPGLGPQAPPAMPPPILRHPSAPITGTLTPLPPPFPPPGFVEPTPRPKAQQRSKSAHELSVTAYTADFDKWENQSVSSFTSTATSKSQGANRCKCDKCKQERRTSHRHSRTSSFRRHSRKHKRESIASKVTKAVFFPMASCIST